MRVPVGGTIPSVFKTLPLQVAACRRMGKNRRCPQSVPAGVPVATFEKRGKTWRAKVRLRGVVRSASFATKAQAADWAAEIEHRARRGEIAMAHNRTVGDAF